MTKPEAMIELARVQEALEFQSKNPYNNTRKERHVREMMAEYAANLRTVMDALKGGKRAR